jgi:hypothetical protein
MGAAAMGIYSVVAVNRSQPTIKPDGPLFRSQTANHFSPALKFGLSHDVLSGLGEGSRLG